MKEDVDSGVVGGPLCTSVCNIYPISFLSRLILKAFLGQDGDNDKTMRMHPIPSMSPVMEVLWVGNLLRGKRRDTSHECTTQRRLHKL